MKTVLLAMLSVIVCAVLGVLAVLYTAHPEVSIDEGWRLMWIGLGGGATAGGILFWLLKQPRR